MPTWYFIHTPVGGEPVKKPCSEWGAQGLVLDQPISGIDKLTFSIKAPFATPAIFDQWSKLTLLKDDVIWFTGQITQQPRRATAQSQTLSYEVDGPWWWLTVTPFQQQCVTFNAAGGASKTMTTTRSRVILSQSLDKVKMDIGKVMREDLYYALYAAQGIPFPTTVDLDHLPPAPPAGGPFQVGLLTPNGDAPYQEVTDKSCEEVLKMMMRWAPDAIGWVDYSITPPQLNIAQRSLLVTKTIAVTDGSRVSGWNPRPRYDLQVPGVILKYEQVNTIDGVAYDNLAIDKSPASMPDNTPRALVMTVDLAGGNATYQKQDVTVVDMPSDPKDEVATNWVKRKLTWIFGTPLIPSMYDLDGITITDIKTDIDPKDPAANKDTAPTGFTIKACTEELVAGAVTKWMTDSQGVFAAKLIKAVTTSYSGGDPKTVELYQGQGNGVVGTRTDYIIVTGTNAATQTYSQLTSLQSSEPVPVGLADKIRNGLKDLHYQGEFEITEDSCSNPVPVGCVFNTSDGLPEWTTMNALVTRVRHLLDKKKTEIEFGPPNRATIDDYVQMLRIQRGRVFSWRLDQRATGLAGTANAVIGHTHTPDNSVMSPPSSQSVQIGPFQVSQRVNTSDPTRHTYQVQVKVNGTFLNNDASAVTVVQFAGADADGWANLNPNDTLWVEGPVSALACSTVNLKSYGNGDTGLTSPNSYWTAGGLTEDDGTNQTVLRKVVATFVAGPGGSPVLATRQTTTNLQMMNRFLLTQPGIYPYPT